MSGANPHAATLPDEVVTLDGFAFDPSAGVWLIRTPFERLTFDYDLPGISAAFRASLRETMARRLASQRPNSCYNDLSTLRMLVRHLAAVSGRITDQLTVADVHSYQGSLPADGLEPVRSLLEGLRRLARAGFTGVSAELRRSLPVLEPYVPPAASPVRTMCPERGALSKSEKKELVFQLGSLHRSGKMSSEAHALSLVAVMLAPRPAQVALLKVKDYAVCDGEASLNIPKVKQRHEAARASFNRRPLRAVLATALAEQCAVAARRAGVRGLDPAEGAIFASLSRTTDDAFPELEGFVGHSTAASIAKRMAEYLSRTAILSERTGEPQRVTAVRMRRTLATGLRAAGHGYAVIGELLAQRGGSAAPAYCEGTIEMAARVSAAMEPHLGPLAALFVDPPASRRSAAEDGSE